MYTELFVVTTMVEEAKRYRTQRNLRREPSSLIDNDVEVRLCKAQTQTSYMLNNR